MVERRDFLKLGIAAGCGGILASGDTTAQEKDKDLLKQLSPPDGFPDPLARPSPKAEPFVAELFVPSVNRPVAKLDPPPNPPAHQRYNDFLPKKFYEVRETEFRCQYHPHPPYNKGTRSWGFDGTTPGPTFHARCTRTWQYSRFTRVARI